MTANGLLLTYATIMVFFFFSFPHRDVTLGADLNHFNDSVLVSMCSSHRRYTLFLSSFVLLKF